MSTPETIGQRLADLGADLVSIEVNTIVKAQITGTKMPEFEHALMDVAVEYWQFLVAAGAIGPMSDEEWYRKVHAGWGAWDACRKAARSAIADAPLPDDPLRRLDDDVGIGKLQRLSDACDQLKGILYNTSRIGAAETADGNATTCGTDCRICRNRDTGAVEHTHGGQQVTYAPRKGQAERWRWIPADPYQKSTLRKIWEVGLQEIAAQTVIQLDGDVVTRVHPTFVDNAGVMEIHQGAVGMAQSFWNELVDIALRMLDTAVGVFKKQP
jgi:hypothetical protein